MSLSLFVRKAVGCCFLLAAAPGLLLAQGGYLTNATEYPLAGRLLGDQVSPRLGLGATGGFLVWQDNVTDRTGFGISAVGLNSSYLPVQAPFRVNQDGRRDQEHPQVALLSGGGAVFVWQGGKQGLQHIYARFLSSSNTWVGGDVMVNSATNAYQKYPAVAVLPNGNVVIAYASLNQRAFNSLYDVYAQLFSPAGARIGGEFFVNQVTAFNQRNPAVAALNDGGFLIAWVSEQERQALPGGLDSTNGFDSRLVTMPTVDIFAKRYSAGGVEQGGAFLVNTNIDACNNPAIAVAADNSFVIAWSESALTHLTNRWAVFARAYSTNGTAGLVRRISGMPQRDQYLPSLAAIGTNYLAVWTSLGQDGSAEGVYGRFLDADGSLLGDDFRVNDTVLGPQIDPTVAADPNGRFLTAWSSYTAYPNGMDLFGKAYVSATYAPGSVVTNYVGPVGGDFIDDLPPVDNGTNKPPGGTNIGPAVLAYPGTLAQSSSNAFFAARGTYQGLFYSANLVTPSSAGYFTATTTERGRYSAKLTLAGKTKSFSGQFDAQGHGSFVLRLDTGALAINLYLDTVGGVQMRGTITGPGWDAVILADRLVFDRQVNPSPFAGVYTIIIPPGDSSGPAGYGCGTVIIDGGGRVNLSGTLADGTKISQRSAVSEEGVLPLYAAPYSGRGIVLSWVQFAEFKLDGGLVWIKSKTALGRNYPRGFTNVVEVAGSRFNQPLPGAAMLDWGDGRGELVLSGAGLSTPMTNSIWLDPRNRIVSLGNARLSLSIGKKTGAFKGTARESRTGRSFTVQGVLSQRENLGTGFFLNNGVSGPLYLTPLTPAP